MTWAVTGAAGFLGAHVVRSLLRRGETVVALVQRDSDRSNLAGLPIAIVEGTLGEGSLPSEFLRSARFVVHLAAVYAEGASAEARMEAVNVGGTREILVAAARSGVERVLHVSTMGTCAPAPNGGVATEADHVTSGPSVSGYVRTKIAGESLALGTTDVPVVVVNPAAPVGAFDRKPTVTGRRVRDVLAGRWPSLPPGAVNYVDARALAEGILLAAARGVPGRRYLLGGENLTPDQFVMRVARASGVARPVVPFRKRLSRLFGKTGPVNLAIDDRRAREELGYQSGDLDEAFAEASRFFRA